MSQRHLSLVVADLLVELFALQTQEVLSRKQDATLGCNGASSVDVVPGNHADGDPGPLAFGDGCWYLIGRQTGNVL